MGYPENKKNIIKIKGRGTTQLLWGLVGILVVTNIVVLIWHFSTVSNPAKFADQYPLIDPARNFIPQEHYISNFQPLREDLFELVAREKENGMDISIYYEFLNTGANISINNDLRLLPASLIKLPIALAVMRKVELGEWHLNEELVLLSDDKDIGYGSLHNEPDGSRFTVERLVKDVIQKSDNTAFNILYRNLDSEETQEVLDALGLADLFDDIGQISAKEYSRFLRTLYTASFINREYSQLLLDWMSGGEFNEYISAGIPSEIKFSHKFGRNDPKNAYSDSGIVYVPNRPYILTVLIRHTGGEANDYKYGEAVRVMKEISSEAYEHIHD